jgi:purine-binding chemotaxis protein CheW
MNAAAETGRNVQLVGFLLEGRRFAVELARVERVLRMVALEAVPQGPPIVEGVFNLQGTVVPVINLRRRLRLPERAPKASDHLLVVRSARRTLALLVDAVENIITVDARRLTAPDAIVPGLEFVRGIARLPDEGMVFIQDIDACLSLEEEARLASALSAAPR